MRFLACLILFLLSACSSIPAYETTSNASGEARTKFRVSPSNCYGILLRGREYECHPRAEDGLVTWDKLDSISTITTDAFVDQDMEKLGKLLRFKKYDTYQIEIDQLPGLLQTIQQFSDDNTKLFFAYSGEGKEYGLLTKVYRLGSQNISPQGTILAPVSLLQQVGAVKGEHCLLISACESATFIKALDHARDFRGTIIAACDIGHATTPCESTGTTALVAAFLAMYEDEPLTIYDLARVYEKLDPVGTPWSNFRHHVADIGQPGLPISYHPALFSNQAFPF